MSWCTSELRVRLAPLIWFKPSSKIFYWPFQGSTSFVDLLCFCSVLCLLCLCVRLFICALWSSAGKGLTSWLSFVVSAVSLSLSHWYPGSGVVIDCIDSKSLHSYLLCNMTMFWKVNFDILTPSPGSGGGRRGLHAKYMLPRLAFVILFNLTMFWKSWTLTFWPQGQGMGVSGAPSGIIFATILLH